MKTIIKKAGILYMALSFGLTSCETFDFGQGNGAESDLHHQRRRPCVYGHARFERTGEHGIYIRQLRRLAPYRP